MWAASLVFNNAKKQRKRKPAIKIYASNANRIEKNNANVKVVNSCQNKHVSVNLNNRNLTTSVKDVKITTKQHLYVNIA